MSKITEVAFWEPTVYQADTNKPNKAGPAVFDINGEATDGFLNAGVQQVTNRTAYLKETLDSHIGSRGTAHTNATQTEAGFMSSSDKTKLNSVETGAQANVATNLSSSYASTAVNVTSSTGTTASINSATTSLAGVLSAADKTKLNGIATGAQVNAVTSVASKTGAVTLVKGDVGLGNVDNTADTAKPVSTAQQTALNLKANLASPSLTGVPTAPTAAPGTSTTQIATTAFVTATSGLPLTGGTLTGQVIGTQARMGAFIDKYLNNAAATGTVTLGCATQSVFNLTLTGATTLVIGTMPTFNANLEIFTLVVRINQSASAQTLNWFSGITWLTSGSTAPATPTANKTVEYIFTNIDGTGTAWVGRLGASN